MKDSQDIHPDFPELGEDTEAIDREVATTAAHHGMAAGGMKQAEVAMDKPRLQRGLDELEGEIISGRYQILRRIGKGGMGVVYLAQQTNLNRNVCIKVLNPTLLDDEDAVGRFEREAKGLSRLQHPNIVTIFDYGRDRNLTYIVMEYAHGETLGKFLKSHGALTLDAFLPIAVQTLKGIAEAHKLGLIHRDIKPANIILCELEGEKNFVKILDFGLAKLAQGGEDLTKDQQLVGSASYMSPEQILTGTSDTRTDVYALGVMFYLMLSGKKPFTGSNDNAILYQHVNATPSPLKSMIHDSQNVPETLCEVIDQCMLKDPAKRPQTALDLLNAISYALDAPQIRAGYSSMSLQSVDLQRISEEADTHYFGSSSGLQPVTATPSFVQDPHGETSASMRTGPASSISGVMPGGVIAAPALDSSNTFMRTAQAAHDRKVLVVILAAVAIVVAAIITYIVIQATHAPEKAATQSASNAAAQTEEIENLFKHLEELIQNGQWDIANAILADIDKQIESFRGEGKSDYLIRKVNDQHLIHIGRKLEEARNAAKGEDYDTAVVVYEEILSKDKANETARKELDDIRQILNSYPQIVFEGNDRSETTFILDDENLGKTPETVSLKPGEHTIRITRDGYEDYEKTVTLEKNDSLTLDVSLKPKPSKSGRKTSDSLAPTKSKPRPGGSKKTTKSSKGLLL